ncbi:MAG: four helix bundle protein [Lewinellaceae bacterium]|nr:four helix bundle protein [Saprospiraceae bacterium]MCB9312056.1 four helix bundle protein [Lewinellaceae bacterium]HRW75199.1 four helix bundle protein [Saprospiraceae bacterium]
MNWIVEELEKPYDLNVRIRQFVVAVFEFVESLPNKPGGWAIQKQLTRSVSSVGANYRAARRGRSKAEYLAKLGTVEEEADESAYWLELVIAMKWDEKGKGQILLDEANELTSIIVTLIKKGRDK